MKIADIPAKFSIPFAANAGVGYIRPIPKVPTGTPGQASLEAGFPPENFTPVNAGGVPPFGQDFNGLLNQSTAWNRWTATGAFPPYDPTWQSDVGGYPKGSCVASLVQFGCVWLSLVDDNVTNPDAGGAGWYRFIQIISANTDLYVNGSTGSNSNDGLTPATAMATIQAALLRAFGFPPSQYTITIHVSDGTYNENIITPTYGGPNVVITGNSVTPSNVVVNGGTGKCFVAQGPNTLTINNLQVQNNPGGIDQYGFWAISGATIFTNNTVSGAIQGIVFVASGGTIVPGNHGFNGNCGGFFYAAIGGQCLLNPGFTYSIMNSLTVSIATALASQCGTVKVSAPQPTFTGAAVTGQRYNANLNGVIYTPGSGANYFPGTIAGATSSGGQYQ